MTLAVLRDMTDLRALEEALRQARAAFEKFYEQPRDVTILVDESNSRSSWQLQTVSIHSA